MKIILLEDETRAANHLERLLAKVAPHMMVVAKLESVRDGVKYLQNNMEPDLIFSDIQLADGLSFEIFTQVSVRCPIIFTTAYDHYAIEAFKTNGIDYLLKPIEEERLNLAIEKTRRFAPGQFTEKIQSIAGATSAKAWKTRFIVKIGDKIKSIPIGEIMVFYSLKASYILTSDKHTYCIDYTLDQLEPMLDSETFFRINRKYIVSISACSNILTWSNSRLHLKIEGTGDPNIIVSRERVQDFKDWLDR